LANGLAKHIILQADNQEDARKQLVDNYGMRFTNEEGKEDPQACHSLRMIERIYKQHNRGVNLFIDADLPEESHFFHAFYSKSADELRGGHTFYEDFTGQKVKATLISKRRFGAKSGRRVRHRECLYLGLVRKWLGGGTMAEEMVL